VAEGDAARTPSNIAARKAELLFRRIGITFAVYGDAEAQERFDPLRRDPPDHVGQGMGPCWKRG